MEDKKAKFIIYIVIALIAFLCSSIAFSITGGLSDWIVAGMNNNNEDQNNNGILDSSEGGGLFSFNSNDANYNPDDDTYSYDEDNGHGLIDKIFNKLFNSDNSNSDSNYYESSSDDNPDFLARLLRMFINGG